MRALTFQAAGEVRVEERPMPEIQVPDDCVVRVDASGVCGSDLHIYHGRLSIEPGFTIGHEYVGTQPWKARIRIVQEAPELLTRPRAPQQESPVMQVSLPVVEEQQDSNATVTALSVFASCPRKYYLSHYLGFVGRPRKPGEAAIASGAPEDLSAGEFGTQVHALLAGN